MIKKYIQGNKESDYELFGSIGKILMELTMHKAIGMAPNSIDGDVWCVVKDKSGYVVGISNARMMKNKGFHVRYIYTLKDGIKEELIKFHIKIGRELNAVRVFTNDLKKECLWNKNGFITHQQNHKGNYIRWELEL